MTVLAACWLLFASAFLSATLLPGSSEAVLIGFLASGTGQPALLVAVASFGNIAGAVVNWGMGRYFTHFKDRPWFPLKDATNVRAQAWFSRYGIWSLLLSWVPIVGDPLCGVAGWLKLPFWPCVAYMAIGKFLRYASLTATLLWAWPTLFGS